jgi:plasmid stabilization system protein ParE
VDWSDEAQLDLFDIQFYIEQRNPVAALRLRNAIEQGAERLPLMPFVFRHGRVAGTREYVVHPQLHHRLPNRIHRHQGASRTTRTATISLILRPVISEMTLTP